MKIFCSALILLMLNVMVGFAQTGTTGPGAPCGGTDIDADCPLDTWVIFLAVIAVVFAAIHLHKKQKAGIPQVSPISKK